LNHAELDQNQGQNQKILKAMQQEQAIAFDGCASPWMPQRSIPLFWLIAEPHSSRTAFDG